MTEAAMRAYLLGKLPEREVALVEVRLLEDRDLFSQLETAEDDLFDAFARNQLDADDRRRFIERFGADVHRRRFAAAFVQRTASPRVLPFVQRQWIGLAAAASLVLVAGSLLLRQPAAPPANAVTAPVPAAPAAAERVLSTVALSLGTSRAAGAPSKVAIAPTATHVDFQIRLNPADKFAVYAVEMRSSADLIIWGDAAATASTENGELIVHTVVPADRLVPGSYEVTVRGGAAAASLDDLGFATIEVSRTQR